MKNIILFFTLSTTFMLYSQTKEYNKDDALYKAKFFIAQNVVGSTNEYKKIIIDPLAAANSTELTSIYYESDNIKGLLLGFFDLNFNEAGTIYKSYAFKNLENNSAIELLNKIESIIESEKKFLNASDDENNIYFNYEDMIVMIYRKGPLAGRIRIAWKDFDAEWENTAFRRTKKRFEKALL